MYPMDQKRSEDLRIQRTHRLLLSALVDLLSEKSFSDLRVKDICERAGVHRSTFYTHFEDKSHLLLFGIQELMDDLIHSGDDRSYPAFLHSVYRILKYFQRNQQEYTRLLLDPKDALVQRLFHDEFSRALKSYLRDLPPTMPGASCLSSPNGSRNSPTAPPRRWRRSSPPLPSGSSSCPSQKTKPDLTALSPRFRAIFLALLCDIF